MPRSPAGGATRSYPKTTSGSFVGTPEQLFIVKVHGLRAAIVNAIKQEHESAVRLAAIRDFRTVHKQLALSNLGVHDRDGVFQIALTPSPSAAKRRVRIEPGYGLHAFGLRIRSQLERRIVLEKEIHFVAHS